MLLNRLVLQNFRQHADSRIEFGPGVTGIIGPNGAGKTTILEAIAWAIYGTPAVTVAFGGTCKSKSADACVRTSVEWKSTYKPGTPDERQVNPKGISTISGIYRESRWWLCDSLFDDPATLGFWPMR